MRSRHVRPRRASLHLLSTLVLLLPWGLSGCAEGEPRVEPPGASDPAAPAADPGQGSDRSGQAPGGEVPDPAGAADGERSDSSPESIASAAAALAWPAIVDKDLYATQDLRGQPFGEIEYERWVTAPADLQGCTLLVHFFLSWSEPCLTHVAEQSIWHARYPDLVVLGVTSEQPGAETLENYVAKYSARYPIVSDPAARMKSRIGVKALPHSVLLSSDGVVRWQGYPGGEDPLDEALLLQVLECDRALRGERPDERR